MGTEVSLGDASHVPSGSRAIVISYRPEVRELAVTAIYPGRANTTRVVEAPEKLQDVIAVSTILARDFLRGSAGETATIPTNTPTEPTPANAPSVVSTNADSSVPSIAPSKPKEEPPQKPKPEVKDASIPGKETFATASFFYPAATNYNQPDIRTHFSFNAFYGHIGFLDGFELGLFFNTVKNGGRGVDWAGLGNWNGGKFEGWQASGVFNSAQSLTGLQLSFGVNRARESVLGGQISGLANVNGGPSSGVFLTFGANVSRANEGLMVAGLTNVAQGKVTGFEGSLFNYAHDVSGVQLGVVNVAKNVSGVQLGLINVADDVDGVPIGLISVTRSGGVHPMFWLGTTSRVNVGLKFATRYTYTFLNISARPINDKWRVGPGFGIGVRVPALPRTYFEPDISATHLIGDATCCSERVTTAVARRRDETHLRLRASVRYEFAKHFSLFAGAGVLGRVTFPVVEHNTKYTLEGILEGFGGVEL
jgi:hypothetical protein